MARCSSCGARESRTAMVEEVFRIDGAYVLVDHIPAQVCARCGDETFSRETTERIRLMVHSQATPTRSVPLRVFEYARH